MQTSITPKELADLSDITILDVRKKPAYDEDTVVIPGATWRDPGMFEEWGPKLANGGPVICYCVHGHEVSQGAAAALRDLGIEARYLEGGIEGWKATGGRLAPRP
ncbi:MAG: sulfurtransferase [Rhodospirillales bacterium]|nr:sulfurtransferase [Rhodospirillales bacterium]